MTDFKLKMELLKITNIIYFSICLITFDFGIASKYKLVGRFASPCFLFTIYFLFFNKSYELIKEGNIFEILFSVITIICYGNILTKVITISYYGEDMKDLFKWIENFYFEHSYPILIKIKAKSLRRTLWLLKLFLKFYITSIIIILIYLNVYLIVNDIQMIKMPWMSERVNANLQIGLYLSCTLFYGIPAMCFGSMGIIMIGVLKLFNECITLLENNEEDTNVDEFILILHKLHCEIYSKFYIYGNIFSYSLFFEITLNAGTAIADLIIIRLYPFQALFYISFIVLVSQLLIYCIFGQIIFTETEKISENLYLTKWYDMNKGNKQILLIMMMMSSRPFGLKAAGMYELNIVLFVQIMKLIFSYCAIFYAFL
uniref:Odorant receptor n=2 Tax=Lutzomyia longipalpis TaxID=7200 RepID=A0A240SXR5_LUTLO